MKNKKRIFAAFAAAAVAVSMFAFAGCGDNDKPDGDDTNKTPAGVIEGDYKEKNDEEIKDIVDNLNPGDLFGDLESPTASLGMHVTEETEMGFAMGMYMVANSKVNFDYKMSYAAQPEYAAGKGSFGLDANVSMLDETGTPQSQTMKVSADVCNDMEYVYGSVSGLGDAAMTGKIDMDKLLEYVGGIGGMSLLETSEITGSSEFDIAGILAMAQSFGIGIAIDDSDGVKVKLSATQETIWKALAAADIDEEMITTVKGAVTFNKFQFDVYFSIDKDGKFDRASEVMDIDVKVNPAALSDLIGEEYAQMPEITAYVKGSTVIEVITEKVTISDTVKAYDDVTDGIIAMIDGMINQGAPDEGPNVEVKPGDSDVNA
ncbi:MAG: hypothetical protein K2N23_07665 [Clostridia bacterium]|nr:hypothetical protein [Clostridia bacterium]